MKAPVITEYRYITRVPGVCGGRPIIKGTRTPVKAIIGYYKFGLSVEEILEGLPHLTPARYTRPSATTMATRQRSSRIYKRAR